MMRPTRPLPFPYSYPRSQEKTSTPQAVENAIDDAPLGQPVQGVNGGPADEQLRQDRAGTPDTLDDFSQRGATAHSPRSEAG